MAGWPTLTLVRQLCCQHLSVRYPYIAWDPASGLNVAAAGGNADASSAMYSSSLAAAVTMTQSKDMCALYAACNLRSWLLLRVGMMGSIEPSVRQALIRATLHLVNREYELLAEDFVALGLLPRGSNMDEVIPALTGERRSV